MTSIDGTSLAYDIFSNMKSHGSNYYTYDASGQRIRKTENGVKTHYIKSGMQALAEYDSTGDLAAEYIHGLNGMIAKLDPSEGLRFFYTDHLGSTRELGSTIFQRDYYPFGETMVSAGDETDYQFTGKELDNNTGLYYFGARYYDPGIGRWLSQDPLAGKYPHLSPYVYGRNNPINRFDPDGMADFGSALKLMAAGKNVINDPNLLASTNAQGKIIKTYCNYGVWDILNAGNDYTLNDMTANQMYDFLSNKNIATPISYNEAVKYANIGVTVILAAKIEDDHGHVAVVAPGDLEYSPEWGKMVPFIFNIGRKNFIKKASYGFFEENQPTAFILNADKISAGLRTLKSGTLKLLTGNIVKYRWGWGKSPQEMWDLLHPAEQDNTRTNK